MVNEQTELLLYIKNMLSDLVFLNGVIATELFTITENTAALRHGEEFLKKSPCIPQHNELRNQVIDIVKKYKLNKKDCEPLEEHVLKHE